MAKTYYGYVEREAESYIDWGAIGKQMSDTLLEVNRIREEKKQSIDKASTDYVDYLSTAPQGEHKKANEWALEFTDNASQYMRQLDVALKSGRMTLKDYTIRKQNLIDDTKNAFGMLSEYQKVYAEKMERYKKNESQEWEFNGMAKVEGFGDFSKSGLWINPNTGKISVAMKSQGADGVYTMSENPNEVTSVDALKGLLVGKWDKFKADDVTTQIAKANGAYKKALMEKYKNITTIEDVLQNPEFESAETNILNASLANPFDRLSVLTDWQKFASNGKQYRFTNDPNDTSPEAIYMKIDPASGQEIPQFTEEQKNASLDWLRTEARRKYDYIETVQALPDKPQRMFDINAANYAEQQRIKQNAAAAWNKILMGKTAQEKKDAAEAVLASPLAQQLGLIGIVPDETNGTISLEYEDDKKNTTFDIAPGGNPIPLLDWARKGTEIHQIQDDKILLSAGGYGRNDVGVVDFIGVEARRKGPTATTTEQQPDNTNYKASLNNALGTIADNLFEETEDAVANTLNPILSPYGITITPSGNLASNYINVTVKGKQTKPIGTNAWTKAGAIEFKNQLIEYINDNLPDNESIKDLIGGGNEGSKWNPK
jgi:hypothetical protein